MKIKLILIVSFLISLNCVEGQRKSPNTLSIGQSVPNILFAPQYPASEKPMYLNALNGKLVLLDFWATWCQPCIEELPKLDSLQNQFGDSIYILAVTDEKPEIVMDFLKRHPKLATKHLRFLMGDTSLRFNYFPCRFFPHEVWIDHKGTYLGATEASEVTSKNIEKILNGNMVHLNQKKDILEFDWHKSLTIDALGTNAVSDSDILSSSVLTGNIKGAVSTFLPGKIVGKIVKALAMNLNINQLFQFAYAGRLHSVIDTDNPNLYFLMHSAVELDVKDSSMLYWPGKDPTLVNEGPWFCYELQIPVKDSLFLFKRMQNDLNYYLGSQFGITASVKDRTKKCWALIYDGHTQIASNGGTPGISQDFNLGSFNVRNKTIREFIMELSLFNFMSSPYLLLDETGYAGKIDLSIKETNLHSIASLNQALRKYGLQFREVERKIPVIVITDKNQQSLN